MSRGDECLRREELLRARLFRVERREYARARGGNYAREIVIHPGAVVILPFLDDTRIVMIRNFRCAVERELIELPAGTLEPGEAPIATAGRELIEETGYRASSLEPLTEFFMSPGILNERMHVFAARGLEWVGQSPDEGEDIQTEVVDISTARTWLAEGRLEDAKTVAVLGVFFARAGRRPKAGG